MEVTILGSGCGIPSLERGSPGILLKIDNEPLLFDSGPGTLIRLLKNGVNYTDLRHVFYTHFHSDHTADLIPLLQAMWTTPDFERSEVLNLYGPPRFRNFLAILSQAYGDWVVEPGFPLVIKEFERGTMEFSGYKIHYLPMEHGQSAIGYRIVDESNHVVVYSGDTDYNLEIIELAKNADVLILECSFSDKNKIKGHLTPTEAAEIASRAKCRHLILTHLYPPYDDLEQEIETEVPKIFSGKVSIGFDSMRLEL
ncbi:hypothetical protein B6I21_02970 [candidate division KSB1 bacterium 4572_119]|nr:MAG: hypothetical protein B6I21_02970 [candidate division KSB1 bacterium 4572_119]